MPPGGLTERAATPEPRELSTAPPAPNPPRTSSRTTKAPTSYTQVQEKEAAERLERRHRRNQPDASLRGGEPTGYVAKLSGELQMQGTLRSVLDMVIKNTNFNKYIQQEIEARHVETTRLCTEVTELRKELKARDEQHIEDIARLEREQQRALAEVHRELADVKQTLATWSNNPPKCPCEEQLEKLGAEVQSLREAMASPSSSPSTDPSTGRSWASLVTDTSVVSSTTRATRADLGLPAVVVEGRRASQEVKEIIKDPARVREVLSNYLKAQPEIGNVQVEGVKPLRGGAIKIFLDSEESAKTLRESKSWEKVLPGAVVQGEQWFPIKVDAVPRKAVFDDDNSERGDFANAFRTENEGAEVKMVRWLSGTKPYGSMAVYLSKEKDAQFLLNRRIVHIRGEAAFTEVYLRRERPVRCRNCQKYGHKQARCPNSTACGRCAGPHPTDECESGEVRCAACGGGHPVTHPDCIRWKEGLSHIRRQKDRARVPLPSGDHVA